MENPVIIFLVPNDGGLPGSRAFPIGWTTEGTQHAPVQSGQQYCLIAFDDTDANIPLPTHTNTCQGRLLPIVTHNSSEFHRNPTTALAGKGWGSPRLCATFSRISGNMVFELFRTVLKEPKKAQDFAEAMRKTSSLTTWDQLAAICQLKIIDPTCDVNEDQNWILQALPQVTQDAYKISREGKPDWNERLAFVKSQVEAVL